MDMALYYPDAGYYTRHKEPIGLSGDYYTTPHLTSLFGDLVAKQLEEMWRLLGCTPFTIVEYGAGSGYLCNQILFSLERVPDLYKDLRYFIVEKKSADHPGKLNTPELVEWCQSMDEVPSFSGCVVSNELLDNFPVHQVVMHEGLKEVFVDYKSGFREIFKPAAIYLFEYLEQFSITLSEGQRTEINLDAKLWIRGISEKLSKGFMITIDYGYISPERYIQSRSSGTIVCYHQHKINEDPYKHTGEQDITAHVNFSALRKWGTDNGFQTCGYTDQRYFLLGLGLTTHLQEVEKETFYKNLTSEEKSFLLHTLMVDMGTKFKVLIQQKGVENPMLSGLRYSGNFF